MLEGWKGNGEGGKKLNTRRVEKARVARGEIQGGLKKHAQALKRQSVRSGRQGFKACLRVDKAMGHGRGLNTRRVAKAC